MRKQAFIFSLDAFVAFTLVMLTINSLIASVSMPRGYYGSLEQAYDSAKDTMQSLAKTTNDPAAGSYLAQIAREGAPGPLIRRTADKLIPQQFGYRFEKYYLGGGSPSILYDSADMSHYPFVRNHTYTKLKVSYDSLVTSYSVLPDPGKSPWCYLHCGDLCLSQPQNQGKCICTPCDPPILHFSAGEMQIAVIRLTVYT